MSKLEIMNKALGMLGANQIKTTEDHTLEAEAATKMYPSALDSILAETDWTFAIKRVLLTKSEDKQPAWGNGNYFELPSDMIKIVDVMNRNVLWRREGNYIYTNASDFGLVYVSRCTDPTFFPSYFVDAFAAKLAVDMCYLLTNSTEKTNILIDLYKGEYLPIAKTKNAREKSNPIIEDSFWVDSTLRGYWG
jgi:hypothetical protein